MVSIRYALTRWVALNRFIDDGRIEIDDNATERELSCVALGRKNFLFAGSDAGGEHAAAISGIESASNFLSFAFRASSDFGRCASETFSPPNFAFQP